MIVELPTSFEVKYEAKNLKYYNAYGKRKIKPLLYDSCEGFCMYCGKTINIEGDKSYHIEHSVDKDGNDNQEYDPHEVLKHCKYNLAIACPECNTVCKKVVDKIDLSKYTPIPKCPSKCTEICPKYNCIRNDYIQKNAILLQPLGKQDPVPHRIIYDLFKHIYVSYEADSYPEVKFLIQNHIDRFKLNEERHSPSIIDLCCKIVAWNERGIDTIEGIFDCLSEEIYLNIIGLTFYRLLVEVFSNKTIDDLVKFCRLLVVLDAVP